MKFRGPYNPATGLPDDALTWTNGNPGIGLEGSIPPHEAMTDAMQEIEHCIEQAGLTPAHDDLTQLWQAIQAVFAGGLGAALGKLAAIEVLPIFPEALTTDGKLVITTGAGSVVIATDQFFVHRGVNKISTAATAAPQRTFNTVASKTYHLRWQWAGGTPVYVLKDLADVAYNPTALAESNAGFDSKLDDMLIAKVVTDGSNVATVTALVNKARLDQQILWSGVPTNDSGAQKARRTFTSTWNWARTPTMTTAIDQMNTPGSVTDADMRLHPLSAIFDPAGANAGATDFVTRYGSQATILYDFAILIAVRADIRA